MEHSPHSKKPVADIDSSVIIVSSLGPKVLRQIRKYMDNKSTQFLLVELEKGVEAKERGYPIHFL